MSYDDHWWDTEPVESVTYTPPAEYDRPWVIRMCCGCKTASDCQALLIDKGDGTGQRVYVQDRASRDELAGALRELVAQVNPFFDRPVNVGTGEVKPLVIGPVVDALQRARQALASLDEKEA